MSWKRTLAEIAAAVVLIMLFVEVTGLSKRKVKCDEYDFAEAVKLNKLPQDLNPMGVVVEGKMFDGRCWYKVRTFVGSSDVYTEWYTNDDMEPVE